MAEQTNMIVGPCQGCGKRKEGGYIKYQFLGFEIMTLLCLDCTTVIQLAGLANLKGDIDAFREQLKNVNLPEGG